MLSLIYHWTRAFSLNALFCSIFEKSLCRGLNGLNWCSLDNCISKWWPSLRNDKNPFHFKFNRITGLDAACEQLPEKGEKCAGMVQCVANESVCCMNYQWEDGCGLAELKRFRLRCPLTAHCQRRLWQLGCTKPAVFMVWSVLNVHPSWRIGRRLLNKVTPRTQASTVGKSLGVSLSLSFSLCRLLSGSLILELQQSAPACLCQKFQIEKCDKVGATLKIDKHTSLD